MWLEQNTKNKKLYVYKKKKKKNVRENFDEFNSEAEP